MIYMCLELEKLETKSFQFCPLRTNLTPKFIPIDTSSIIDLLVDKDSLIALGKNNKNELLQDIETNKKDIWAMFFNLDKIKQKNYSFDYRISTDCFSVSIQLLHNSFSEKEKQKKLNMKNKKKEMKETCKDMNQEEKEKYKLELEKIKKLKQEEIKLENKKLKQKMKDEFKKLSNEEKIIVKEKMDLERKLKNYIEFPYLEELDEIELTSIKNNYVVIDPGKRTLLYMKNKDGKRLRYTNKTHIKKIKRLKYNKLLQNYRDKNGTSKKENKLSFFNSRTCNYEKFKEYILNKNIINKELFEDYKKDIFRKYKWYGYINRKRAETDLVKDIKKTFGNDVNIVQGDWSCGKNMRHMISTPNLGLKRKLNEYFNVYNLEEFRTSLLNYKTEEKCENLYLPDKKGVVRKLHSVLTFQTENKRSGCINRDENSVNNMLKIVEYYLEHKDRPEKFKRNFKFEEPIKDINHS